MNYGILRKLFRSYLKSQSRLDSMVSDVVLRTGIKMPVMFIQPEVKIT